MNEQDTGPLPRELEAHGVGGQQVHQQHSANEPATGKGKATRNLGIGRHAQKYLTEPHQRLKRNPSDAGAEIFGQDRKDALIHLSQRAHENQGNRQHEHHHRESKRCQGSEDFLNHDD